MTTIYEQHDAAFKRVSAFVILKDGERVATVAFKFPADGAGRLYAYIHWIGIEMVRGYANGYGYDKKSAACESAMERITNPGAVTSVKIPLSGSCGKHNGVFSDFQTALHSIGGSTWDRRLEDAGFTVVQAV